MHSFKSYLEEKRAHAEMNPKVSAYDVFEKYKDKDVYVHFADVPKIGILPVPRWDTPAGIYGWNLQHYGKKISELSRNLGDPDEWRDAQHAVQSMKWFTWYITSEDYSKKLYFALKDKSPTLDELRKVLLSGVAGRHYATIRDGYKNKMFKELMSGIGLPTLESLIALIDGLLQIDIRGMEDHELFKKSLEQMNRIDVRLATDEKFISMVRDEFDPVKAFPYGVFRNYIFIFDVKDKSKLLVTSSTFPCKGFKDREAIEAYMRKLGANDVGVANVMMKLAQGKYIDDLIGDNVGERLYKAVRVFSSWLSTQNLSGNKNQSVIFTDIFRTLGFVGVTDTNSKGNEVIYASEAQQTVVFTLKDIKVLDMIQNDSMVYKFKPRPKQDY